MPHSRLQFTHQGQTLNLQSSSDIAAWIAERRKRFPTQARAAEAAERRKQQVEAQRVARQAVKDSQERRRAETKQAQDRQKIEAKQKRERETAKSKRNQRQSNEAQPVQHTSTDNRDAAALKAKMKIEKLRKRLEKEERRVAKAEAKGLEVKPKANLIEDLTSNHSDSRPVRKRKRTDSLKSFDGESLEFLEQINKAGPMDMPLSLTNQTSQLDVNDSINDGAKVIKDTKIFLPSDIKQEPDSTQNPLTPTSQPSIPDTDQPVSHLELPRPVTMTTVTGDKDSRLGNGDPVEEALDSSDESSSTSMSDSSSDLSSSDDEDTTSSEGSSSSSNDSPETAPSKVNGPVQVPPPKRIRTKTRDKDICRNFLKNGRCPRGKKCRFRHELPAKGSQLKRERQAKMVEPKKERKSLYQRVSAHQSEYVRAIADDA